MRYEDQSTLGIGNSWKAGVVVFKSNCIILCHHLRHYLPQYRRKTRHLVLKTPAK